MKADWYHHVINSQNDLNSTKKISIKRNKLEDSSFFSVKVCLLKRNTFKNIKSVHFLTLHGVCTPPH